MRETVLTASCKDPLLWIGWVALLCTLQPLEYSKSAISISSA